MKHIDFDHWNNIVKTQISNDGQWVAYHLKPGSGDQILKVHQLKKGTEKTFYRAEKSIFSDDGHYLVFQQKIAKDSLDNLRRKKVKKDKLPKDTLVILNLKTQKTNSIPHVLSYKLPEKWNGWLTYTLAEQQDSTLPSKKMSKKNGYHLIVHNLKNNQKDTLFYVLKYALSEAGKSMVYESKGKDSTEMQGVYYYDFSTQKSTFIYQSTNPCAQLSIDKQGTKVAFVADVSDENDQIKLHDLYYWQRGTAAAVSKLSSTQSINTNAKRISPDAALRFSDNSERLYFGLANMPMLPDSNLLPEEMVQVEIWHYQNGRLHTQQNAELDKDKKQSFTACYQLKSNTWNALATDSIPSLSLTEEGNTSWALGRSDLAYQQLVSWEGFPRTQDIYSIDVSTAKAVLVAPQIKGSVGLSATGRYIYWYNALDSNWYAYSNDNKTTVQLSAAIPTSMADERNDVPNVPYPYGIAGWAENDAYVLVYDRYDIWKVDPSNPANPQNLTKGRAQQKQYRYQDLDRDNPSLDAVVLFKTFDETTKAEGYAKWEEKKGLTNLLEGDFKLSRPIKAQNSDDLVFTKQNFIQYPDLIKSDLNFEQQKRISNANPQQQQLHWGTAELYDWVSLEGIPLQGLLYKPDNFDSSKQYPLLVYFYERYSDRLHQHRGILRSRSSINPTFYTSRGYVVFMPDIVYRTGYPGESCYNAVIPGVTSLIEKGFIDQDKIGVQGHSWGGYQIAYLVTKTNIFTCAEAGAPVSNMISAYGGIRWQTGLSRMFQYEHTQSRLGGTLWEKPMRYIENSPIFYVDKIQTPLLLLHNDKDGHVPWYQGIELYVALRRLGKTAWMLNYNGEPHWPTSYENIRDLTIRMQQYFDYYLQDAPMPEWMYRGIPAIEKGINDGQSLMGE